MDTRRGQALVELAIGMLAVAIVVSAVTLFAVFMVRSLHEQNTARGPAPEKAEPVEVDDFAQSHFAGCKALRTNEKVDIPSTVIMR